MSFKMICVATFVVVLILSTIQVVASEDNDRDPTNVLAGGGHTGEKASVKEPDGEVTDPGSGEAEASDKHAKSEHESLPPSEAHAIPLKSETASTKVPILPDDEQAPDEKNIVDNKDVGSGEGVIELSVESEPPVMAAAGTTHDSNGREGEQRNIVAEAQTDPQGDSHHPGESHELASKHLETGSSHEPPAGESHNHHVHATNHMALGNGDSSTTTPVMTDSTHEEKHTQADHKLGSSTNQLSDTHDDDQKSTTEGPGAPVGKEAEISDDAHSTGTSVTIASEPDHPEGSSTSALGIEAQEHPAASRENQTKTEEPVSPTETVSASSLDPSHQSPSSVSSSSEVVTTETTKNTDTTTFDPSSHQQPSESAALPVNGTTTDAGLSSVTTTTEANNSTDADGGGGGDGGDQSNEIDDGKKPGFDAIDSQTLDTIVFSESATYACTVDCQESRPQMTCVGRLCNKSRPVTIITCHKLGNKKDQVDDLAQRNSSGSLTSSRRFALPVNWGCMSSELEPEFQVMEPEVVCERYNDSGHRWLISNSCSLLYSIDRLNSSALQGPEQSNFGFITGTLVLIACFGIAFLVIKAVIAKQRHGMWFPAYCAMPLKARMNFRRKRENDDDEPVNVHFDMGEEQTTLGARQMQTYGNDR